jgi:hypothetical protein
MVSGGVTHTAIVPLDLIKCRIQVNPQKYEGIIRGFKTTISEEGLRALAKGWAPTAIGYSLQGPGHIMSQTHYVTSPCDIIAATLCHKGLNFVTYSPSHIMSQRGPSGRAFVTYSPSTLCHKFLGNSRMQWKGKRSIEPLSDRQGRGSL